MAIIYKSGLPILVSVVLSVIFTQATPVDVHQDLEQRNNIHNLACSNAPNVIAGTRLDPSQMPAITYPSILEPSGSNEPWMNYLWCTPNTTTYTFFGVGTIDPIPSRWYDVYGALSAAVYSLTISPNKVDGPISGGVWHIEPATTNIQIWVQNSNGTMTYGVLKSALYGLQQAALGYIHSKTLVFQINDGQWGEMGIGYVGFFESGTSSNCVYDIAGGKGFPCSDVRQGWVIK